MLPRCVNVVCAIGIADAFLAITCILYSNRWLMCIIYLKLLCMSRVWKDALANGIGIFITLASLQIDTLSRLECLFAAQA